MPVDINREIGSVRARPGWNFLALALNRLQDSINQLPVAAIPVSDPPPAPASSIKPDPPVDPPVPTSRQIVTTFPLVGGGNLASNRTIGIVYNQAPIQNGLSLTGKIAVISPTPLVANAAAGVYRINADLILTTAGTSGNLVANIIATDDLGAQTVAVATIASIAGTARAQGSLIFENAAVANINYSVTASGTLSPAVYNLYLILERIL